MLLERLRVATTALPLEGIADEAIAHVYRLWTARRGARAMPTPNELRPEEFGIALGKVNLLDVLRDPLRFAFRVRGGIIAGVLQQDMRGRDVGEMQPPEYRDMLLAHYTEAATAAAPTHYLIRQSRNRVMNEYRRLILPLGGADGTVERLLSVSAWGADFARKAELMGLRRR
ncbi:MAG: PAS domain-containing protein [Alphaproteobacteria bacterium]|nr:PAS domain-containing protein [Alphaproteobacteria bacterium]